MRSVATILISILLPTLACADDDPIRSGLISRIELQYTSASIVGSDSPMVAMLLTGARSTNPSTDETTWTEVRVEVAAALTSALTAKGAPLDVMVRGALDPLSTAELKRLSTLLADPVYKKFQTAMSSSDNQKRMVQAVMGNPTLLMGPVFDVLKKHNLSVPH
jgi:hypothetical protein